MSRSQARGVDEVADGVFRLGTSHVNWYVVVDGTSVTVVDTGLPRYWPQLERLLTTIGRSPNDIEAVLLTHADPDHLGNAERIAMETGATVFVHEKDVPAATRQVRILPPRLPLWRPPVLSFAVHAVRNGIARWQTISSPSDIEGNGRLDVPGRPTAIHTPGHTPGSVCYNFDNQGVVFVGDALLNKDPISGEAGCIITTEEISADQAQARESIAVLNDYPHQTVLFGHGDPWHQGIRAAVLAALT